jgi:hypothetical protein
MLEDLDYFQKRASVERSRALDAPTQEIAAIHDRLAGLYEDFIAALMNSRAANDQFAEPLPHRQEQAD